MRVLIAEDMTLLIADDDPAVRSMVAKWVWPNGFRAIEADCAGDALDRMADTPAAVALCDINLPDRNGMWLAAQLRRQFPDMALVMMTDYGITSLPLVVDANSIGCLTKPFTQEQLLQTLDWALQWRLENAA
jgi:DNA-binding NtrC family response regulator